jgi:predicted DNA-binding transcriptional regulator AlpA
MQSHIVSSNIKAAELTKKAPISISPWVNEQLPPWDQILSAHDVARLTRRKRWVCVGLAWIRRFPRKRMYRGRALGWLKSDVLEWMARERRPSRGPLPKAVPRFAESSGLQQRPQFEHMGLRTPRRRRPRRQRTQRSPSFDLKRP